MGSLTDYGFGLVALCLIWYGVIRGSMVVLGWILHRRIYKKDCIGSGDNAKDIAFWTGLTCILIVIVIDYLS